MMSFELVIGQSPKRAIEFYINLAPRAEPVNRPSSRMTLTEMEELKVQLVDLDEKCFIRPSSSLGE